ncbi:hypothetical protein Tco_0765900 [Tanacetum coccineum]
MEVQDNSFPMAIYVVSGDEDGERGAVELRFCALKMPCGNVLNFLEANLSGPLFSCWYLPLLAATFTFSQSLGILKSCFRSKCNTPPRRKHEVQHHGYRHNTMASTIEKTKRKKDNYRGHYVS